MSYPTYADWYRLGPYAEAPQTHRAIEAPREDRVRAAGRIQVMNVAPPAGTVVEPPVPEYALHLLLRSAPLLQVGFNRRPRWVAVSPGALLLAPPDTRCEFVADEPAHALTVAIPGALVDEPLRANGEEVLRDPRLARAVVELWQQAELDAPGQALLADQVLRTLAGVLARRGAAAEKKGREVLPHHLVRRLRDFVETRLAEELDVPMLAAEAGLSAAHFARAFTATIGVTPFRYVMMRRLARARDWVEHSRRSALEIALEAGFKTPSHFTARFRREYGETPSAARAAAGRRASSLALNPALFDYGRTALHL